VSVGMPVRVHPITCHEGTEGEKRYGSTCLTIVLVGGGWLTLHPSCFSCGNYPLCLV